MAGSTGTPRAPLALQSHRHYEARTIKAITHPVIRIDRSFRRSTLSRRLASQASASSTRPPRPQPSNIRSDSSQPSFTRSASLRAATTRSTISATKMDDRKGKAPARRSRRAAARRSQTSDPLRPPTEERLQQQRLSPPEQASSASSPSPGPSSSATSRSLGFVLYNQDPSIPDQAQRSYVKSFIKHNYHEDRRRRRRQEQTPSSSSQAPSSRLGTTLQPSALSYPFEQPLQPHETVQSFSNALSDFESPVFMDDLGNVTDRDRDLVQQYLYTFSSYLYAFRDRLMYDPAAQAWYPLALTDETFFRTLALTSQVQAAYARGVNVSGPEHHAMLDRVLRSLQTKLVGSPEPSQSTICAICCLASLEMNIIGDYRASLIHRRGAAELVRAAGGYEALDEWNRIKMARTDVEGALLDLSVPILPMLEVPRVSLSPDMALLPGQRLADAEFVQTLHDPLLGADPLLIDLMVGLRKLAEDLDAALSHPTARIDPASFEIQVLHFKYLILSSVTALGTPPATASLEDDARLSRGLQRALRLAGLMFARGITRADASARTDSRFALALHSLLGSDQIVAALLRVMPAVYAHLVVFGAAIFHRDAFLGQWYLQKVSSLLSIPSNVVGSSLEISAGFSTGRLTGTEGENPPMEWPRLRQLLGQFLWIGPLHDGIAHAVYLRALALLQPPSR